jgi:hypothetical protein
VEKAMAGGDFFPHFFLGGAFGLVH